MGLPSLGIDRLHLGDLKLAMDEAIDMPEEAQDKTRIRPEKEQRGTYCSARDEDHLAS